MQQLSFLDEPALDARSSVCVNLPELVSNLLGVHPPRFLLAVPPQTLLSLEENVRWVQAYTKNSKEFLNQLCTVWK